MVTTNEKNSPTYMKTNKTLILCSCDSSLKYDPEVFKRQGFDDVILIDQLCGNDLDVAVAALTQRDQVVFACEQQSQIFDQLTEELHLENALKASLDLIDLRDRAGWTAQGRERIICRGQTTSAFGRRDSRSTWHKVREITSSGTCLIIAKNSDVLSFAETLGEELAVTCVLEGTTSERQPITQL